MVNKILTFCFTANAFLVFGQPDTEIVIANRSFEDIPRMGINELRVSINGWYDCGSKRFKDETPPDIHPGKFWDVDIPPSQGNTYIGMVVRDNDTWEGVSQRLEKPIKKDKCYYFSVELAQSPVYKSHSRVQKSNDSPNGYKPMNFVTPAVFRMWGGTGFCNERQLLAESKPIDHAFWKKYQFKIKPNSDLNYIMIEAFYKTPVLLPYCGHILLDNLSNFKEIECEDEVTEIVDADVKPKVKTPPHKQARIEKAKQKEIEQAAIVEKEKPKPAITTLNIDTKKLKVGSTIEIKNLYFKADTTSIIPESYIVLEELFTFLKQNANLKIEIGGHTNGIPPPDYCNKLSTARAKSVYDYLVTKGIPEENLSYKGYGKTQRIFDDNTADGRKKNQRVEIKILSMG